MIQPLPEAHHIPQTFQVDFDRMLCNTLEKYHSSPGFTLLLGSILQYRNMIKNPFEVFPPGLVASLFLFRQQGEGNILDDMGFSGITANWGFALGTLDFLVYFKEFLNNPWRSWIHAFDAPSYVTAAKECLQLYLCNHHKFSQGATDSDRCCKVLLRNKPWTVKVRLGANSRIPKAIRWRKSFGAPIIHQDPAYTLNTFQHENYRSLSYKWALELLPLFLEESAISLELANMLRTCTFATMAQQFRRKMMLARKAITAYLLRVESAVGTP